MALVLVVEENPVLRRALGNTLRRLGLLVALADNGDDGVTQYRRLCPDLVITELVMSGKDGIETLWEIRDINPAAKVIALVDQARGELDYSRIVRRLGANEVLRKPVTESSLAAALRKCLPPGTSERLALAV